MNFIKKWNEYIVENYVEKRKLLWITFFKTKLSQSKLKKRKVLKRRGNYKIFILCFLFWFIFSYFSVYKEDIYPSYKLLPKSYLELTI
jgi:hypothetical protein